MAIHSARVENFKNCYFLMFEAAITRWFVPDLIILKLQVQVWVGSGRISSENNILFEFACCGGPRGVGLLGIFHSNTLFEAPEWQGREYYQYTQPGRNLSTDPSYLMEPSSKSGLKPSPTMCQLVVVRLHM